MRKKLLYMVSVFAIILSLAVAFAPPVLAADRDSGTVYAMTNNHAGNQIVMFSRDDSGGLIYSSTVPTTGNGGDAVSPPDPLKSQGSLVLTQDGRFLLAVNYGSNNVTVFRVNHDGLTFLNTFGCGGTGPTSISISDNIVYVLNNPYNFGTGSYLMSPAVAGFRLTGDGALISLGDPIMLSTPAGTLYSTISLSPGKKWLVVTDVGGKKILVFPMHDGVATSGPVISPSNGAGPFGITFGQNDQLLVSEAGAGAVSTYQILNSGSLKVVSASVPGGNTACWIVKTNNNVVFTTNPGGAGTISSYRFNPGPGTLTSINPAAATGIVTIDEGITHDGHFLYALGPAVDGIYGYKIGNDGSLTLITGSPFVNAALTGNGVDIQGIAVR